MKSLVVLASHPQFAADVRAAVEPLGFRVVHRLTVEEAEPLLVHGFAPACILDLGQGGAQGVWTVERIRRRAPGSVLIAFCDSREPAWEEDLYLSGVTHVFGKPVRGRLLAQALKDLASSRAPVEAVTPSPVPPVAPPSFPSRAGPDTSAAAGDPSLSVLRRFSEILTNSLDERALVRQFLNLLRELMGVNRAAVFLRSGTPAAGDSDAEPTRMKPVCAVGIAAALADHVALSTESGIGAYLLRTGRLLRRQSQEASEIAAQREFEMIGAEVALPIMGRETMIGVALFDTRVTGHPLTNGELEAVFHLLEQVGLAITNIWAHDQLVGSNQLLGDVLRELSNACVVVGPDLTVLHANKAARRIVGGANRRSGTLDFGDLPEALGGQVYQVIKTGAAIPTFRYEPGYPSGSIYNVSVVPIRSAGSAGGPSGTSALLVMEDRTQAEQLQKLEVETASLRLVNNMADRLAAEIGNAILPLSVHHQLFDQRIKEAEFRKSLKTALGDGVRRVDRLATQMRFLYGNATTDEETIPLGELLEEADQEARRYFSKEPASLDFDSEVRKATISGNRKALRHSFSEIILNGYQANTAGAKVRVRLAKGPQANGAGEVGIEFEDSGQGFSEEVARQAMLPFFTQRPVGVGLGLSAARKIVEGHGGRLEIPVSQGTKHGVVRIFLPTKQAQE